MQTPIEFLETRRSIPATFLTAPGPDAAALDRILTIATRVPDHGKLAPWRFIIVAGDHRLALGAELAAIRRKRSPNLAPKDEQEELNRFASAPLVLALVSRPVPSQKAPEWEQVLSTGAVAMNLLNAVHASGFAANWLTDWPVYDPAAKRLLDLGEGERLAGFFHIGTPTIPPQERWRPNLADLVTTWRSPTQP